VREAVVPPIPQFIEITDAGFVLRADADEDFFAAGTERPARVTFFERVLLLRFCCAMSTSDPSRLQPAGRWDHRELLVPESLS